MYSNQSISGLRQRIPVADMRENRYAEKIHEFHHKFKFFTDQSNWSGQRSIGRIPIRTENDNTSQLRKLS